MRRAVFVDLTEKGASVCSVKRNGKSWTVDERIPAALSGDFTLSLEGLAAEESYVSLPLSELNFRIMELPFSDPKKIRELLPFEIEGLILGRPADFIFDIRILGESDGKTEFLVAYIPKERLGAILRGLKRSGLDPRVVTSLELSDTLSSTGDGEVMSRVLNSRPVLEPERTAAALREMAEPSINMRRDEFAYTAETEKTRKSLKLSAGLVVTLLAIFVVHSLLSIAALRKENRSLRDDIRKSYIAMFPQDKRISDELYQAKAHMKELKEKQESLVGTSPLRLMLELSAISGPETSFSELNIGSELIVLKGECPSLTDAQRIKNQLDTVLEEVNISDARPSVRNRTLFTITAKGRRG